MTPWRAIAGAIHFRWGLWCGNVTTVTLHVLTMQVPGLVVRAFLDGITGGAPADAGVYGLVAVLAGAGLTRCMCVFATLSTMIRFHGTVSALLQKNMLTQVLRRPGCAALPGSPGEAISRFREDAGQLHGFGIVLSNLIRSAVTSGVAIAVMAAIDVQVTLIACAPVVAVYAIVRVAQRRIETYRRVSREAAGRLTGFLGEVFGAAALLKLSNAEDRTVDHLRRLNEHRGRTALRDSLFESFVTSVSGNAIQLGVGAMMLVAASRIRDDSFSVGDLALFTYYIGFVTALLEATGYTMARYRQVGVSVARMERLMPEAPEGSLVAPGPIYEKSDPPPVPPLPEIVEPLWTFRVEGLTYRYPGSENGIFDIDLGVRAGELVVVTGRVGSGKSTLLHVMLGLLPKASGLHLWNDAPVADPAGFLVPPRCAFTPQVPHLFSETLRDSVAMGLPVSEAQLREAAYAAVLEDDVEGLGRGFDTLIGARGVRLSGGQLQRTAAARVFVREPELFVFDDLSSALDVETERRLWERFSRRRRATCLAVSHRRAVLQRADQVVVLREGCVEAAGELREVLETSGEMRRIWATQAGG